MKKLTTIQKRENLNDVFALDKTGNGGAFHKYAIYRKDDDDVLLSILFQNGPRKLEASIDGVLDTDLLEIVRHRLQCFQAGEFCTKEGSRALNHVEEALLWLNKRVEDRIELGILGTMNK